MRAGAALEVTVVPVLPVVDTPVVLRPVAAAHIIRHKRGSLQHLLMQHSRFFRAVADGSAYKDYAALETGSRIFAATNGILAMHPRLST